MTAWHWYFGQALAGEDLAVRFSGQAVTGLGCQLIQGRHTGPWSLVQNPKRFGYSSVQDLVGHLKKEGTRVFRTFSGIWDMGIDDGFADALVIAKSLSAYGPFWFSCSAFRYLFKPGTKVTIDDINLVGPALLPWIVFLLLVSLKKLA
jgi:hypothetical protein